MRQSALIVILALMGSFVPAEEATIGPIDRIFTRIGAADDLAGGRSTFMMEMLETANILHNATCRSLVLMDEIGRGTSTYDGLSLAYGTAIHLAEEIKAFTLFATHYFELTTLPDQLKECANIHLDAVEHRHKIVFLHQVKEGPADRSYGLQVAGLAGVPPSVLDKAKEMLRALESEREATAPLLPPTERPPEKPVRTAPSPSEHPLIKAMAAVDPNELTPREALALIFELKKALSIG